MNRKSALRAGPKGPSQRQLRVGEVLRHALAEILLRGEIVDPDLRGMLITISEVRASPDIRNATVYIQTAPEQAKKAVEVLSRHRKFLRGALARRVDLRYVPDLIFRFDSSINEASRIDTLLRSPGVVRDLE
jgi:ribosome-binding factor A